MSPGSPKSPESPKREEREVRRESTEFEQSPILKSGKKEKYLDDYEMQTIEVAKESDSSLVKFEESMIEDITSMSPEKEPNEVRGEREEEPRMEEPMRYESDGSVLM